ncbi:Translation machinery-associated protein 20 [Nosema granulosis]|uniref:Translation machinery-associated protein 20 n=1 Tax=Nosema granulosis TaxID=83296 RepID=A0A9P6H1N2_9MICR|nr:Translation machinery-associated protein 20 [Nosema granulosis]
MKSLFHKIEPISSSALGKKDKKNINNILKEELLDKNKEYKVTKCKNKTSIITLEEKAIFFLHNGKYYPTIKFLEENNVNLPSVYVDEGAVGPIHRGANIMAPGIYKYIEKVSLSFSKGSMVVVKLINGSILGIGISLLGKDEFAKDSSGEAVEMLHHTGDDLYKSF